MSAALIHSSSPRVPVPPRIMGPGSRRQAENNRWRGRGAAARWLAEQRIALRSDVDFASALKIERNNEYRARRGCAAGRLGGDRSVGEVDIAAPGAIERAAVVDFARLRSEHPERWNLLWRYLQGCRAAQRVALALADGVPTADVHRVVGTTRRAVNYARQTLRTRLAMMAAGTPLPKSRKSRPAADLWEAAGICARSAAAPARPKRKRRKLKSDFVQLDLFDLAAGPAQEARQ